MQHEYYKCVFVESAPSKNLLDLLKVYKNCTFIYCNAEKMFFEMPN